MTIAARKKRNIVGAILVLGTRKAESALRAANMARRYARRLRERLSPNDTLPKLLVY